MPRKLIKTIPEWRSGDYQCECGETVTLWFNGGELDEQQCSCGRLYRTVHREIDLEILGPEVDGE